MAHAYGVVVLSTFGQRLMGTFLMGSLWQVLASLEEDKRAATNVQNGLVFFLFIIFKKAWI